MSDEAESRRQTIESIADGAQSIGKRSTSFFPMTLSCPADRPLTCRRCRRGLVSAGVESHSLQQINQHDPPQDPSRRNTASRVAVRPALPASGTPCSSPEDRRGRVRRGLPRARHLARPSSRAENLQDERRRRWSVESHPARSSKTRPLRHPNVRHRPRAESHNGRIGSVMDLAKASRWTSSCSPGVERGGGECIGQELCRALAAVHTRRWFTAT